MARRVEDLPGEDLPDRLDLDQGDLDGEEDGEELEVAPRRGRTALAISLVLALVAAALVAVLGTREPAQNRRADSPLIGRAAPALAGGTLDGGDFDIDDHRGRWVIVNFFATWCVPCRQEHPELVAFDEGHRELEDATLVSVLYDDDPDTAAAYFARNGGEWPVVLDADGAVAVGYGVSGVPETYLVAPTGRVYAKLIGGVTQDGLEEIIAEAEAPAGGGGEGVTGSGGGEEQP